MKISQRTINSLKIFLLIAFVVELYSFSTVTIDSFARIPNLLFEIYAFVYSFSKFLFPVVFVSLLIFVNKQKSDMQKVLSTNLRVITCLYIVNFIYRTFLVRNIFCKNNRCFLIFCVKKAKENSVIKEILNNRVFIIKLDCWLA